MSILKKINDAVLGPLNVFSTLFGVCYAIPNTLYNTFADNNADNSDYYVSSVVGVAFLAAAISAAQKYLTTEDSTRGSKGWRFVAAASAFVTHGLAGAAALWPILFAIPNTLIHQQGFNHFQEEYVGNDQNIHVYTAFAFCMLSLLNAFLQEYAFKRAEDRSMIGKICNGVNKLILDVLGAISITWVALFAAENALIEQFDPNAGGYNAKLHNAAVLVPFQFNSDRLAPTAA